MDNLTTGELLRLVTLLTRDVSAVWTLATAAVSLLSVSARRPRMRTIAGGTLVWFVALGGYFSPVDKSQFFSRGSVNVMLVLALAMWTMVVAQLFILVAERRLQR